MYAIRSYYAGLIEVVAPMTNEDGGSWNAAGDIVFTGPDSNIVTVKQTGENLRPVSEAPKSGHNYFRPDFLPDGRHFLYFARGGGRSNSQIRWASLDGGPAKVVTTNSTIV